MLDFKVIKFLTSFSLAILIILSIFGFQPFKKSIDAEATLVIETDLKQDKIRVKRELESGWFQWVELPLPASISIQSGLNTPRYPSLKGIMSAKKKEIKTVSASSLTSGAKVQAIDKILVPTASKQTEVIDGELDHIVGRIIEIMKSEVKVI